MAQAHEVKVTNLDDHRPGSYQGVGAKLRFARVNAGRELGDVADALCIRYPHLLAIEEGRFDDLPGPAYVIGFLRAYSEFLGLDTEEIVDRFKDEAAGFVPEQSLNFPEPPAEGWMPNVALIAASVVLVVVVIGGWLYVAGDDSVEIEKIAEVPSELTARPPAQAVPAEQPAPSVALASDLVQADNANALTLSPSEISALAATNAPPAPEPTSTASNPPPPISVEESAITVPIPDEATGAAIALDDAALPVIGLETSAPPAPSPVAPVPRTTETELTPASEPVDGDDVELGQSAAITGALVAAPEAPTLIAIPPSPPATPDDGYQPRVYGQANSDARVVLRARGDSWVQVQGGNNELILTRILHPGDTYLVPNRSDLTLITGNAGGLEVLVDGQLMPSLGSDGAVRRNISLDADALLSGVAYAQ